MLSVIPQDLCVAISTKRCLTDMDILRGKNCVITGCLQGIGKATLEAFCREGANVFACCQMQTDEFEAYCTEMAEKYGTQVIPVYFDLMDDNSIKEAAKQIQKAKMPVNALVNIAGMTKDAFFQMVTQDQLETVFRINFFSQILFSQYMVKLMQRAGGGSVVFTSSIAAINGNIGQLAYSSSKAALIAATKTMSAELANNGIRVNAIAPGMIDTAMTQVLDEEVLERLFSTSDIKRLGKPQEVADVLVFLASDLSRYVTGQVIRIDGGVS